MISRGELVRYVDNFLACSRFNDYAPNGLQVEGRDNIQRICTAVTASDAVIHAAIAWQADALLVHHGYFWRGEDPVICGMKRVRLGNLLKNNLNLLAYHLPLDCHPELGNNACLAKLFSLEDVTAHKAGSTEGLLWIGRLASAMSGEQLAQCIAKQLDRAPLHIAGTDKPVNTLALCSGGAQDFIETAHALGADAFLSGEISERTYYQAKELGLHYYAAGHHATERYGIQSLGAHLADHFKLEHQFIDSDNPV